METLLEASGLDGVERMWQIDRPEGRVFLHFTLRHQHVDADNRPALLLSTASSTVLLRLHPSMEVAQLPVEIAQSPTLAASSLSGTIHLVTPQAVFSEASLGETTWSSWTCAKGHQIIAAQAAGPLIVLAVTGGDLVVLEARPTAVDQIVYVYLGNFGPADQSQLVYRPRRDRLARHLCRRECALPYYCYRNMDEADPPVHP